MAPWKFGWWENNTLQISSAAKSKARAEYDVIEFDDLDGIEAKRGQFRSGDWVLRFRLPKVTSIDWLFVDYVVGVPREERKVRNSVYPYQAIQTHPRPLQQAPFDCKEKRFIKAFRAAVRKFGPGKIETAVVIPARGFLKLLKQEY